MGAPRSDAIHNFKMMKAEHYTRPRTLLNSGSHVIARGTRSWSQAQLHEPADATDQLSCLPLDMPWVSFPPH